MKRILVKGCVLLAVFAAAIAITSAFLNNTDVQSTAEKSDAQLPALSMSYDGTEINQMFGYCDEIEEYTLRDTLTLLPTDRTLTLNIKNYGVEIKEVNYRITSFEDGSIVENGRIKSFTANETGSTAEFYIETPITMSQEYTLRFEVTTNIGTFYYYTRLLQRSGQNLNWYLEFVQGFYANCLTNNVTDEMKKQLEPETASANSSLHSVNIHSNLDQITWGDLAPTLVKKPIPTILEVNETTVSIKLDYIISAKDTNGGTEYYTVSEYYRMRKSQDYVILLDFEREATQFFDPENQVLGSSGLNLGITGKDVSYASNEDADIAVFVQAGEVWEYDRTADKAARIFTFTKEAYTDDRAVHNEHGVSISAVDDDGTVTFIVYGYMNSGAHEGMMGVSIYRYYPKRNTTEELMFIESDQGFNMLERSLSRLAYVNESDQCFVL